MILQPKVNIFNTGEVTPYMYHRHDFKKFPSSCARMENCIPLIYGPFIKRSGSRFVSPVKTNVGGLLLVPFIFSETQAYILEFGDNYVRFYINNGQVIHTLNTVSAWATATEYTAGYSYVKENDIIYRCIEWHTSGTFATDLAAGKWLATDIYEVPSPYYGDDLFKIDFEQNNDVLFMTLGTYKPMKLSRYGHTNWIMEEVAFKDGPYQPENADTTKFLAPSATTGNITIQATGHSPFSSGCVGQHVWMKHTVDSKPVIGWAKITAYNDEGNVNAVVGKDFGAADNTTNWRLGHYSVARGYPYTNTFFSGRHYYGGTPSEPGRVDGSVPDDYETFSPVDQETGDQTDASAIIAPIASGKSNIIQWLLGMNTLFVGTTGAEHAFEAEGGDTALTPTNYYIKEISQHGSKRFKPIKLDNTGIFIQKAGRKLRELAYSYTEDKYIFPDLSIFAEHLTHGGIKQIAYQEEPNSIFWIVKNNGDLISFTYDKRQEVIAWGRQYIGGKFTKVLSVAIIPHPTENRDQVWIAVERYVNGALTRSIEYLEAEFNSETKRENGFFVDSGYTYNNPVEFTTIYWEESLTATVVNLTNHGLSTDDKIIFKDILGYSGTDFSLLNDLEFTITKLDDNNFTINQNTSTYAPYIAAHQGGTFSKFISKITSGLNHLEGEEVDIVVDGVPQDRQIVTSGAITLTTPGAVVHIGLPFEAYWKSLKLSQDLGNGTQSSAKKQKIHSIDIDIFRTNYCKYGMEINGVETLYPMPINSIDYELITDKIETDFGGNWDKEPQVILKSDKPVPLCITSITPTVSVN